MFRQCKSNRKRLYLRAVALIATLADPIAVSLSLGAISSTGLENETAESLLSMADKALYRAKSMGRNRAEIVFEAVLAGR